MTKKGLRFPHTISYRLTDEDFVKLEQEVNETGITAHDWCRLVVQDRLNREFGLSKNERLLFAQVARIQYLVSIGFQLLADGRLTTEKWKEMREYSKDSVDLITHRTLETFRSKMNVGGRKSGSGNSR